MSIIGCILRRLVTCPLFVTFPLFVLQVYILSTAAEDNEALFVNRSIDSAVQLSPAILLTFDGCMPACVLEG